MAETIASDRAWYLVGLVATSFTG